MGYPRIFLSLWIFGLLTSSSLTMFQSQRFGWYILRQVFHVELGTPHRTSNWTLYLIHGGRLFLFCYRGTTVFLVILTSCWDWTCNLLMISLRSIFQSNTLSTTSFTYQTIQSEFLGLINNSWDIPLLSRPFLF